jgi:hypothetical protein
MVVEYLVFLAPFVGLHHGLSFSGRVGHPSMWGLLGALLYSLVSLVAFRSDFLNYWGVFLFVPSLFFCLEVFALVKFRQRPDWRVNAWDYNVDIIPHIFGLFLTLVYALVLQLFF